VASALTAVLSGGNIEYFRFRGDFSAKKTKISGRKLRAIREIRWLEEGSKGMLTSILSISELWMSQREAFF
jgi:hypothetical protein